MVLTSSTRHSLYLKFEETRQSLLKALTEEKAVINEYIRVESGIKIEDIYIQFGEI